VDRSIISGIVVETVFLSIIRISLVNRFQRHASVNIIQDGISTQQLFPFLLLKFSFDKRQVEIDFIVNYFKIKKQK